MKGSEVVRPSKKNIVHVGHDGEYGPYTLQYKCSAFL